MMKRNLVCRGTLLVITVAALFSRSLPAYAEDPKAIVAAAVQTELSSDRSDHTAFLYRDHDVLPDKDTLFLVCETPEGMLKNKLEDHGKPLTPEERHVEDLRLHAFLNDRNAQQRAQHDSSHDDSQAEEMLKLLPTAYLWTIASETGDLITLNFKPDPAFNPHTMEAHVLSGMAGEIVIARSANRIRTIKGTLVDDVRFGYGLLGRLRKGGTFEVQRREVVPHHWQVTESHVHLDGHALFFKTIGAQEDESRTDFKVSTAKTLQQAYDLLQKR